MEEQQKPKYNMWQNTGFMVKNAWKNCKSVLFLCVALAVTTATKSAAELFLAPTILEKVETTAPLSELLFTIAVFSCGLLFLSGLKQYIDTNTQSVSYTHLTLPTTCRGCRSRWSPYH